MKLIAVFCVLAMFIDTTLSTCSLTPEELDAARRENIRLEGERLTTNDYATYVSISNQIFNLSAITYYIEATGVFPPVDAVDYVGLLVPNPPLLPVPGARQFPNKDFTRVEEVSPNVYIAPAILLTFDVFDPNTLDYLFKQDGVKATQYLYFDECSALINTVVTKADRAYNNFQTTTLAPNFPPEAVCPIGFGVCAQAGLLAETGFFSIQECIEQYHTIPAVSPCPSAFTSDTVLCRAIHAFSTIINATVHCPHLPFNSPVCFDRCLPECEECSVDAHCVEQFNDVQVAAGNAEGYLDYFCECNNGYTGDGENCALKTCTAPWNCQVPGKHMSGNPYHRCEFVPGSSTGICQCAPTLHWNPVDGSCECREDQHLEWENGIPMCLDNGKCLERHQCPQHENDIECRQFDFPNTLSLGDWCLCNPGFENYGVDNPDCVCSGTRIWSPLQHGNVCIHDGECIAEWNCQQGESCHIPNGNVIGTCS